LNRGGILLREEKLKKELPKVEKDLLAALIAWEHANGTPFLVQGEVYATSVQQRKEQTKLQRDQERLERVCLRWFFVVLFCIYLNHDRSC
jgi:hypothetical protein